MEEAKRLRSQDAERGGRGTETEQRRGRRGNGDGEIGFDGGSGVATVLDWLVERGGRTGRSYGVVDPVGDMER